MLAFQRVLSANAFDRRSLRIGKADAGQRHTDWYPHRLWSKGGHTASSAIRSWKIQGVTIARAGLPCFFVGAAASRDPCPDPRSSRSAPSGASLSTIVDPRVAGAAAFAIKEIHGARVLSSGRGVSQPGPYISCVEARLRSKTVDLSVSQGGSTNRLAGHNL